MEDEFSRADRQADRHDEANSSFAQFWLKQLKLFPATSFTQEFGEILSYTHT